MRPFLTRNKASDMEIKRWPGTAQGRNRAVAYGDLVWTVATATDASADFPTQAAQSLQMLQSHLALAGSAPTHLLSLQVMLTDIANRSAFDVLWQDWIGPDPAHWPQRACFQAALAPGLLIELVAVAAPAKVSQSTAA
jgi:enamine deaminase RidA (YjgF/YER057c/UK114 family)